MLEAGSELVEQGWVGVDQRAPGLSWLMGKAELCPFPQGLDGGLQTPDFSFQTVHSPK